MTVVEKTWANSLRKETWIGTKKEGKSVEIGKKMFLDGTNYANPCRINKGVKKRTQNELFFERNKCETNPQKAQTSQPLRGVDAGREGTVPISGILSLSTNACHETVLRNS